MPQHKSGGDGDGYGWSRKGHGRRGGGGGRWSADSRDEGRRDDRRDERRDERRSERSDRVRLEPNDSRYASDDREAREMAKAMTEEKMLHRDIEIPNGKLTPGTLKNILENTEWRYAKGKPIMRCNYCHGDTLRRSVTS